MKILFQDTNFAFEFLRLLGETNYGGADINECFATAARIEEGDYESWFREWNRTAQRIQRIAEDCLAKGHNISAREAFLRASNYYRSAEFFMHMQIGKPDLRSLEVYDKSVACFHEGIRFLPFPAEIVKIPYEGTSLPGYFYRPDASATLRPTLLMHGGYDSTAEEQYFETVPAALARGYNCLVFEGPGQGSVIRHQNLPFRPDWENVAGPVVEYALTRKEIDPSRLILVGKSLGGLLAPRAAAYEQRLAACIAIDGVVSLIPDQYKAALGKPGEPFDEGRISGFLEQEMRDNANVRWAISQGMWTMQASSLADCIVKMLPFDLDGIAGKISCPTLVCDAERDHTFAGQPKKLFDALQCPKTYLRFTTQDAAEEHCHAGATLLLNQRVFDWLDERFVPAAR